MSRKTLTASELHEILERLDQDQPDLYELKREVVRHAMRAARHLESIKEDLKETIGFCCRNLGDAVDRLNDTRLPNSLGVLQANGVRVDVLCSRAGEANDRLEEAVALMQEFGIV